MSYNCNIDFTLASIHPKSVDGDIYWLHRPLEHMRIAMLNPQIEEKTVSVRRKQANHFDIFAAHETQHTHR